MASSANFGNMFSMAGVSLLLPEQVLLTNFLTDLPETTIAADTVDPELINRPTRWDIGFIRRFMLAFGLLSSVFDYTTFGVLLFIISGDVAQFRTAWFIESMVRTRRPFFRSRPSTNLLASTIGVAAFAALLPLLGPLPRPFALEPLPASFYAILGLIAAAYLLSAEAAKRLFYRTRRLSG